MAETEIRYIDPESHAQDRRVGQEKIRQQLEEVKLIPSVQEALDRARDLQPEALDQAVAADQAEAKNIAWSARDYATQRLSGVCNLQMVIDMYKQAGKDTAEYEASLKKETDRLARFLLRPEAWPENEKDYLPNNPEPSTPSENESLAAK